MNGIRKIIYRDIKKNKFISFYFYQPHNELLN